MDKINRNSYEDAQKVFKKFLPDNKTRLKVIDFLAQALEFANAKNPQNWNLNLDKNASFIRFNVGIQYCIQIGSQEILVLCDRLTLKPVWEEKLIPVTFPGYARGKSYKSDNIDAVPDLLRGTKNSIGCLLKVADIYEHIDLFRQSNFDFIRLAIEKTKLRPDMEKAHSKGVIAYLSRELGKEVENPAYAKTDLPTLAAFLQEEENKIREAKKLSREERKKRLEESDPQPKKTIVSQVVFNRNSYVVAEILDRAKGVCQRLQATCALY
jgi:hypothetical protein